MRSEFNYKELQEKGVFNLPFTAFQFMQLQRAEIDELQERLDAALKLIPSIKAENDLHGCDQVERQIELLEQALKGVNKNNG